MRKVRQVVLENYSKKKRDNLVYQYAEERARDEEERTVFRCMATHLNSLGDERQIEWLLDHEFPD